MDPNSYQLVLKTLGPSDGTSGMVGLLNNYARALGTGERLLIVATWTAANIYFISQSPVFQQTNYEIILLPFFAQMANMHLGLLRDGLLQGFSTDSSEIQLYITTYTQWISKWSAISLIIQQTINSGKFNPLNQYKRWMQIGVRNFSSLWPYYDTSLYPNAVTLPAGPEIFYTVSECIPNLNSPGTQLFPTGSLAGYVTDIDIWSCNYGTDYSIMEAGCDVTYDSGVGSTGYTGHEPYTDWTGPPPVNKPLSGVGTYTLTSTTADSRTNPIIRIDGNYSYDHYIRYLQFTFKDQTYTKLIPSKIDGNKDTNVNFTIIPQSGYWLSSMWMASNSFWYSSTSDAVFGFTNFTRVSDSAPDEKITIDPEQWIAECPVHGSANWVVGHTVKYAISWIDANGKASNLTPWTAPVSGGARVMPTLTLPVSSNPTIKHKRIYRQFKNSPVQCVGTVSNETTTFGDRAI
ncbi:hypothetical protein AA313_de0209184 [Arthrobotrys entomopaga]|nr:hypothetical protein AA313_de0209184 [Arthrobotrys entomopaga]